MSAPQTSGAASEAEPAPIHRASLPRRMVQGARLVVLLMLFNALFKLGDVQRHPIVFGVTLVVVAIGGAVGGATYYATDAWRARRGWWKTLANVVSILAYAFFVLGILALMLAIASRYGDVDG